MIKIGTKANRIEAMDLLLKWLKENSKESNIGCKQCIEDIELECECGDIAGLKAYFQNDETTIPAYVIICRNCAIC